MTQGINCDAIPSPPEASSSVSARGEPNGSIYHRRQEREDRSQFVGGVSFTRSECDAAEFVMPHLPFFPSPPRISVPPEIYNEPHPHNVLHVFVKLNGIEGRNGLHNVHLISWFKFG